MQLEIGISTNLYFPAIGTAGLDLLSVNGAKREPCPPPKIIAKMLSFIKLKFVNVYIFLCNFIPRMVNLHYKFSDIIEFFFIIEQINRTSY